MTATSSAIPVPTTAVAPDTVEVAPTTTDGADGREVWDYVALGDSWTGLATWPELYAGFIEEDLGVEVMLHDESRLRQRADRALDRIRTDERLRNLVAQAEVITINFVGNELARPLSSFVRDDGSCGGEDGQDCLRAGFAEIQATFSATLDEVVALRSPDSALITTFAMGVNMAERMCGEWGNECWQVLAGYFIDLFDFATEAATTRGLRVADALSALHAPGPYEVPINNAYVQADRVHLTDAGSAVVAQVLRDLGYEL